MAAQQRQTDGLHILNRCLDQLEQQVKVVNHQVEDDTDIGGPSGERAQALADNEFRLEWPVLQLAKRGVEALDVADLERGAMRPSHVHEAGRLLARGG